MAFKEGITVERARQELGRRSLEERNEYVRAAIRVAMAGLGRVVEKERMARIDAEDANRRAEARVGALKEALRVNVLRFAPETGHEEVDAEIERIVRRA